MPPSIADDPSTWTDKPQWPDKPPTTTTEAEAAAKKKKAEEDARDFACDMGGFACDWREYEA